MFKRLFASLPASGSGLLLPAAAVFCAILTALILLIGLFWSAGPLSSAERDDLLAALHANPGQFWNTLRSSPSARELGRVRLREILEELSDIERNGNGPERNNALIARADLLYRHGYPPQALDELNRAMEPVEDSWGRTSYWWLRAEIEHHLDHVEALASTTLMLMETGYDAEDIETTLAQRDPLARPFLPASLIIPIWMFLLLLPALHLWLMPGPTPASETAPPASQRFGALRLGLTLLFGCTAAALLLRLPAAVFPQSPLLALTGHVFLSFLLILYPAWRHDRLERRTTWTPFAFARFTISLLIITLAMPITFVLSWLLIQEMAVRLPFWAVLQPVGPALGLPALSGLLLLLLPWGLPTMLGWRSLRPADPQAPFLAGLPCPVYIWELPGSGFSNALTIGYLSPSTAIGFTQPLLDGLTTEQIKAIAAHEAGHVQRRHLLLYFLVIMPAFLVVGLFAALNPIGMHRHLVLGPSLPFALALIIGFFLWLVLFTSVSRRCEHEADRDAADVCGREVFLSALTRLYDLNQVPEEHADRTRKVWSTHPGLQERKRALRTSDGTPVFPSVLAPDPLLIACWRARLALEWKGSLTEATNLVAFEFDSPGKTLQERLSHCAERHAQLGSECLVLDRERGLDILTCAQKRAVRSAEPPLPVDVVCLICRSGVQIALGHRCLWNETADGCHFGCSPEVQSLPKEEVV